MSDDFESDETVGQDADELIREKDERIRELEEKALALLAQVHGHGSEGEAAEFEPFYSSLDAWVTDWLLPNYSRPLRDVSQYRWDPQWWRYSEVVMRLEALWASWEKMRLEGGPGIVAYFRDYLDPMMRVMLDPAGPFHTYDPNKTDPDGEREMPEPLPHSPLTVPDLFRLD